MQERTQIPYFSISRQYQQIKSEVLVITEQVLNSMEFSSGIFIEKFEHSFATYCQTNHAVACSNGTSALHLALAVLGIGLGDEVIVPANTFIATAWAVSYTKAVPVFVDCLPDTWQINPQEVEANITSRTKAIIGVHLYGQPFDVATIQGIAQKHGLWLIEDASQAHGATFNSKKVGSFGEMACFSFYPSKNLGAFGEAGAITTQNSGYANRLKSLRNQGVIQKYDYPEVGYNYRIDSLQAAILDIKLKYLDDWNSRRKDIATTYRDTIQNPKITMQTQSEGTTSANHLFVITTPQRQKLVEYLQSKNIGVGLHYPVPCHLQKAYQGLGYKKNDLPQAEYLAEHCLSLPMYAELTNDEIGYIIEAVNSFK